MDFLSKIGSFGSSLLNSFKGQTGQQAPVPQQTPGVVNTKFGAIPFQGPSTFGQNLNPEAQPPVASWPGYQQPQSPPTQVDIGALGNAFNSVGQGFGNLLQGLTKGSDRSVRFREPTNEVIHQSDIPLPTATPQPTLSPTPQAQKSQVVNGLGRNPDVIKKSLVNQVAPVLNQAATEFGIPPELLYDIGFSEGGFRTDAKNETAAGKQHGVPEGLFQFTPYTWNTVAQYARQPNSSLKNWLVNGEAPSRSDPVANARAAAYLIKVGQLGRWDASKSNWGRFYDVDELDPYYAQTKGYVKGETFN